MACTNWKSHIHNIRNIQNNTKYGGIQMSDRIKCVCVLKFLNRKLTHARCMGTDLVTI